MAAQEQDQERLKKATGITLASIAANVALALLKIAVGLYSLNRALVADGIHSASDLVSDFITLITVRIGAREADVRMHYGYRRVETVGALFVSLLLVAAGGGLIVNVFHAPEQVTLEGLQLLVALVAALSVAIKEILFQVTRRLGIKLSNQVLIANAWHHRSDAVSSVAVLLSVVIYVMYPEFVFIDAIATVIIAGLIFHAAWEIGADALKELIDFSPSLEIVALVEEMAERVPEVTFIHNLRIRTMGGALYVELYAETDPNYTIEKGHEIAEKIRKEINQNVPNVIEVMVHISPKGDYLRRTLDDF
jgi:cation diffusion facilitator family transporter